MEKILLVGVNARFSHPTEMGRYLRNAVAGMGYDVVLKEFTIHARPEEIARYVLDERPAAAAFSVYIWNTRIAKRLMEILAPVKDFPVVLGGPEVSYNASEWIEGYPGTDFIITGHGEEGFRRLVEAGFSSTARIIHSHNPHFSEIPFPYTDEDLVGFAHRNVYYESSRGCPFRCAYCLSSRADQKLEFRDVERVGEEIGRIASHRPKLVKIVDRTFNADAARARAIWKRLMERYAEHGTTFHFEVHPSLLGEEDLVLLESAPAGLFQFELGIQSTHRATLEAAGRRGNWEKERAAIAALLSRTKVSVHVDLIAALPFEDLAGIEESFNRVYALGARHFQLGTLKLLPGTEMRERAGEYGMRFSEDPPYEVEENYWLSRDDMPLVKKIARLLDGLYNSGAFRITLSELLSRFATPWELYAAFAAMFADTSDISWLRMHGLIEDLVSSTFPTDIALMRDCLSWDWFSSFDTHRIPAFIKNDAMRAARRTLDELVRTRAGKYSVGVIGDPARARVFAPETVEFRVKYMQGKGIAVFVGGNGVPVLL